MRWQKKLSNKYHSRLFNVEGCLLPIYPQRLNLVRELKGRPDDIYVASFTKAGTTWTQEMVFMIATGMDYNASDKHSIQTRFPYLDMGVHPMATNNCSLRMLAEMPHNQPRFIKAHLPFHLLPHCVSRLQNKVVYVMRNPSDVIVSCFHFFKRIIKTYTGTFHDFFDDFINDRLPYCPYLDHVLGYWRRRQDPNICVISYEEMHMDFRGVVRRVAAFLERPMSEAMVDALVEHCSFKSMRCNPSVNYETEPVMDLSQISFMRKGIVGDWQNHFTPGMQAAVMRWVNFKLRGSGLKFVFTVDPPHPPRPQAHNNTAANAATTTAAEVSYDKSYGVANHTTDKKLHKDDCAHHNERSGDDTAESAAEAASVKYKYSNDPESVETVQKRTDDGGCSEAYNYYLYSENRTRPTTALVDDNNGYACYGSYANATAGMNGGGAQAYSAQAYSAQAYGGGGQAYGGGAQAYGGGAQAYGGGGQAYGGGGQAYGGGGQDCNYGCYFNNSGDVSVYGPGAGPASERRKVQDKRRLSLPSHERPKGSSGQSTRVRSARVVHCTEGDGGNVYDGSGSGVELYQDYEDHQRPAHGTAAESNSHRGVVLFGSDEGQQPDTHTGSGTAVRARSLSTYAVACHPNAMQRSNHTGAAATASGKQQACGYAYGGVPGTQQLQQPDSCSSVAHAASEASSTFSATNNQPHDLIHVPIDDRTGRSVQRAGSGANYFWDYGIRHRASTHNHQRSSGYRRGGQYSSHENQFYPQFPQNLYGRSGMYAYTGSTNKSTGTNIYGAAPVDAPPLKQHSGGATTGCGNFIYQQPNFINRTTPNRPKAYAAPLRRPPPPPPDAPTARQLYSGYYYGYCPLPAAHMRPRPALHQRPVAGRAHHLGPPYAPWQYRSTPHGQLTMPPRAVQRRPPPGDAAVRRQALTAAYGGAHRAGLYAPPACHVYVPTTGRC